MRRRLATAVLLALAACQDGSPSGSPPAGRPPPPAAGVTASLDVRDAAGGSGPFRLDDLVRMAIEARIRSPEGGPHAVRVDVLNPRGTLYAQLRGSVDVGPDVTGVSSHTLEVQGTPIESFRQVGRWRFVLSVDGGAPLAAADVDLTQ